jgi:hypothetical protein
MSKAEVRDRRVPQLSLADALYTAGIAGLWSQVVSMIACNSAFVRDVSPWVLKDLQMAQGGAEGEDGVKEQRKLFTITKFTGAANYDRTKP